MVILQTVMIQYAGAFEDLGGGSDPYHRIGGIERFFINVQGLRCQTQQA